MTFHLKYNHKLVLKYFYITNKKIKTNVFKVEIQNKQILKTVRG